MKAIYVAIIIMELRGLVALFQVENILEFKESAEFSANTVWLCSICLMNMVFVGHLYSRHKFILTAVTISLI